MLTRSMVLAHEGTKVTLRCASGHEHTVDFSKGPIPKRIGVAGVAMLVKHWRAIGVTEKCPKCKR